jgi:hypothetical protein
MFLMKWNLPEVVGQSTKGMEVFDYAVQLVNK